MSRLGEVQKKQEAEVDGPMQPIRLRSEESAKERRVKVAESES